MAETEVAAAEAAEAQSDHTEEHDRYMIVEQHMNASGTVVESEIVVTESEIPDDGDYEKAGGNDEARQALCNHETAVLFAIGRDGIERAKNSAHMPNVRYVMRSCLRGELNDIVYWQYNPATGFATQNVVNTAPLFQTQAAL